MEPNDGASGHDVIRLIGLGGVGRHGVLEEERRDGQTFLVDLALHLDTSAAAATDDLDQTVDYADVATSVVALIEGESVQLIETLAARIADAVLARELVHAVEVTVHKPEAPVGVPFTDVQVSIRRGRAAAGGPRVVPAEQVAAPPAAAPPAAHAASPVPPAIANEGVPTPEPTHDPNGGGADLDREPDGEVEVVLALGGNVGDVRTTLRAVVEDLREAPGLEVRTVSPLARTAAVLEVDAVAQQDYLNAVVLATTTLSPNALLELTQSLEASYGRRRQERWGERTLDIDLITYGGVTSSEEHLSLPHPRANERAFVLVPWAQADQDAFLPGLGGGPVAVLAETAPDRAGVRWLALDWLERSGHRTGSVAESSKPAPAQSEEPGGPVAAVVPQAPEPSGQVSQPDEPAQAEPQADADVPSDLSGAEEALAGAGAAADPSLAEPAAEHLGVAEPEPAEVEPAADEPAGDESAEPAVSAEPVESAEPADYAAPVELSTPERGMAAREAEPAVIEPESGMPPAFEPGDEPADEPVEPAESIERESADPSGDDLSADDPDAVSDAHAAPGTAAEDDAEPPEPVGSAPQWTPPAEVEESDGEQRVDPDDVTPPAGDATPEPDAEPASDQQTSGTPAPPETVEGAEGKPSSDFRPRWQPLRGDEDT